MARINNEVSAKRIKELIDQKCGGSQQKFADLCGIGKYSVSQYVNAKNSPGNFTAVKISRVFGVDPLMSVRLILDTKKDPRRSESLWGLIISLRFSWKSTR